MRYNALKSCAALLCRACEDFPVCVAEHYLTLRTGCEKHGRKNPLPYSFSKRSHIGNLRQISKQGKGRSSKRKENRRLSFLFAPPRGAARSRRPQTANPPAEVQRKTSRPVRANTLTQFARPAQPVQEKEPPVRANPPAAVRVPRLSGAGKRAAPSGRTRLRQFARPGQPVQEKEPPRQGEHANAVRVPRLSGAGKRGGRKI